MIKKLIESYKDYLNYLRDLSHRSSPIYRELAIERLKAHREYMDNRRRYNPYLHPEEWDAENN